MGGLTGCGERRRARQTLAPVEIDRSTTSCELDGMLLSDYPGPKAQVHYAGQAQTELFCDTVELFNTLLAGEGARCCGSVCAGHGQAGWEQPVGHWIDAKTAIYVLGSKRHGSMGPTTPALCKRATL